MLIRARMGVSVDGDIATPDGLPALLAMPCNRCRTPAVRR